MTGMKLSSKYLGGSKDREQAIFKWNQMKPTERAKLLQLPTVKSQTSMNKKFEKAIDEIMKF